MKLHVDPRDVSKDVTSSKNHYRITMLAFCNHYEFNFSDFSYEMKPESLIVIASERFPACLTFVGHIVGFFVCMWYRVKTCHIVLTCALISRHNMLCHAMAWCDMMLHVMISYYRWHMRYDVLWDRTIWYGTIQHEIIWCI